VADEGKLVQIAINLIDNALKALDRGPEDNFIRISTGADSEGSWLVVEDTGRGVAREIERRIFEPFFTTGSREGGTGLGLTLSLEYAREHRGDLTYERRHPRGSRFTLTVPRDTELTVPVARAPMRSEMVPITKNRILLIDDEPAILRAFRRVLEPSYAVSIATTVKEAFELLDEDGAFDAVICDVNMPDLGGVEFYRRLDLKDPDLARRVVFCSGGVLGEASREFIEATRNPVLHKPLAPDALLEAVGSFLQKRRSA
jgi:CheY-like chemotaxis protein